MNYSLKRKNNFKLICTKLKIGFEVNPSPKYTISISKIDILDTDMIKTYITRIINKKFEILFKKMYKLLINDDESDEDPLMILDEITKLKEIVITKYKKHIDEKIYKDILKKLLIAEDEFKNQYTSKLYNVYENIIEEENKTRSI